MLVRLLVRTLMIGCVAGGLAACKQDGSPGLALAQPRGASVAFDAIDGLPKPQFQMLVQKLNDEAQSRRLAVISRDGVSAYRVHGALAATVTQGRTTVSWTWDVFDTAQKRVLQITGQETAAQPTPEVSEAWNVADDAMMRRIAQTSMEQLTAFLTSPEIAPAAGLPDVALDNRSPEAAGIYRIYRANADPLSGDASPAGSPPLPPRRPETTAVSTDGPRPADPAAVAQL
ncbi:MAG: hypothetical protein JSR61_21850 [Proteobacteria bacterium]|nr:hypothetical protein [Pseudomonadota bacterium]